MFCFYRVFAWFHRYRIGAVQGSGTGDIWCDGQDSGMGFWNEWPSRIYAAWWTDGISPAGAAELFRAWEERGCGLPYTRFLIKEGKASHHGYLLQTPRCQQGKGEIVCVKKGYFFKHTFATCSPCWLFISDPCPFLFRPLSVRDTFIYALCTLFSNYGINKALPPKPT